MVVIIVDKISPRINYLFSQVFQHFLKVQFRIIESSEKVNDKKSFLINYSTLEPIGTDLRIIPNGLLNEVSINNFTPNVEGEMDEVKVFINSSTHFGFDVFAAIFWMITRYEEYTNENRDGHNRFQAKSSLAHKHNFLTIPIVDLWINKLSELINQKLPGFVPKKEYSMTNTIDVDNAFAYKGKEFVRKMGAFSRDLLKGKLSENKKRAEVLRGKLNDPFDTYDYIKEQATKNNINTIFFHLVGEKSKHDRNIKVNSDEYIALLNSLKQWSSQGLHPSYLSNSIEGKVTEEKVKLEFSLGKTVEYSRQHFLMLSFPKTYNALVKAGINHDFSMGYADQIGFRAGTSLPFKFFDLSTNTEQDLLIHPFCLMDGTLRDYMKLSVNEAKVKVQEMRTNLQKLNLSFISIWHNETLSETNGWQGWRAVYEAQFK